ncbi:MAG TPA: alpha/beta fold hydrolase [Polyangiaceae bacterium]|nr:alpha/beta fold hydrolase [Polyangiaceae bacterium]
MKERSCQFGAHRHLSGIVTEPDGTPRAALVLVSAGLVPKFGPFRLYAELARHLARTGFITLRFDVAGVGDSQHAHTGLTVKERTANDVSAALDWLYQRYDFGNLVLGGLCSGAEDSFRSAEHDPRVTGVVMIDPFAYRTRGFLPRHVLHRLIRRTRRALGTYRPIAPARAGASGERIVNYEYMSHSESSRILQTLLERRARVHFMYTGGAREVFNHRGQLRNMFPEISFDGLVTVDHLPALEHTQMLAADRDTLVGAISSRLSWIAREPGCSFGGPLASRSAT